MTQPAAALAPQAPPLDPQAGLRGHAAHRRDAGPDEGPADQVLDQQIILLKEALEKAQEARDIVFMRDFDAHQEAKAHEAQQTSAVTLEFDQLTQGLTWDEDGREVPGRRGGRSPRAEEAKIEGEQPPF
jgi:hypothetical protein